MRQLFAYLLLCMIYSCNPDPASTTVVPNTIDGTVQYKVNKNLVSIRDVNIASGQFSGFTKRPPTTFAGTTYELRAQNGISNSVSLIIATDSLTIGPYIYSALTHFSDFVIVYNGQRSSIFATGDHININITNHSSGLISGTFTGKFTPIISSPSGIPASLFGMTVITDGQFRNIKCIY